MRAVVIMLMLAGTAAPYGAAAQDVDSIHYGSITSMGGETFYMQLPGLRPNRSGEMFDVPDPIFAVTGRGGNYTVRARGGDAAVPVLQDWAGTLCDLMLRQPTEISIRARGQRRIAEVSCQ